MSSVLKGNFEPKNKVTVADATKDADRTVEERFETEAMKRLGGSIAFVAKKKIMWDAEPPSKDKPAPAPAAGANKDEDGK